MGKMAILMILGLTYAVGYYTYTISQRSVQATDNFSDYYAYTNARNIAHSAVNIALREIELHNVSPYQGTFGYGSWRVDTTSVGDTLYMTARTWYMDTSYVMHLKLQKYAKPFPKTESAVGLNVRDIVFEMSGAAIIDGRDHDMNGNVVGPGIAGVTVPTAAESSAVVSGATTIIGNPEPVSTSSNLPDPGQYIDEYILNADYTYNSGSYSSLTWGSAADPKIIYSDGTTGSGVRFTGNVNGWGILIVKGKLWLGGNFSFRGLVIMYGSSEVEKDTLATGSGTPDILGVVVMAGAPGSLFEMKGKPKFAYSKQALENARDMQKLSAYEIFQWWE